MARIVKSVRDDDAVGVLRDIVDVWLPALPDDPAQAAVTSALLGYIAFDPLCDAKVVRLAFLPSRGPRLTPEPMPREPDAPLVHGWVNFEYPNDIFLNRALVEAVNQDGGAEALSFLRGKVLHEITHWCEARQVIKNAAPKALLWGRPLDHGRRLENVFLGRDEDANLLAAPLALRRAIAAAEATVVATNAVGGAIRDATGAPRTDGVLTPAARDGEEAFPEAREARMEALGRGDPVVDLGPLPAHADPEADRLDTFDYAHLAEIVEDGRTLVFDRRPVAIDQDALALFCALSDLALAPGEHVLFGLRGAVRSNHDGVAEGTFLDSVEIREARFDHSLMACVLGVWARDSGRIAVFEGSTVPNLNNMGAQVRDGRSARTCNKLPTGLYNYFVGQHKALKGAFVSGQQVVTLRSDDDLRYTLGDRWDRCRPGDNIHPTFRKPEDRTFSSAGCQTVASTAAKTTHTGPWKAFRTAAGLTRGGAGDHGRRFQYLLLTARELRLARFLLDRLGRAPTAAEIDLLRSRYGRLRFGSSGERVKALQRALALDDDGDFGSLTAWTLIARQRDMNLRADGLCTPEAARRLGAAKAPPPPPSALAARGTTAPTLVTAIGIALPVRRGDRDSPAVKRVQQLLNRMGAFIVDDGHYGAGTEQAVEDARTALGNAGPADRADRQLAQALMAQRPFFERTGTEGAIFIALEEITNGAVYRRRHARPHWPGVESGVTIGVGYDLRFVDEPTLRADWPTLVQSALARLSVFCGNQGSKTAVAKVDDITIPLDAAAAAFRTVSLPRALEQTRAIYPRVDTLPQLCAAALISLVYNRGASLEAGHRRSEMVAIKEVLDSGGPLEAVPPLFESMTRLWPDYAGLRTRRIKEAALFRRGLAGEQPW